MIPRSANPVRLAAAALVGALAVLASGIAALASAPTSPTAAADDPAPASAEPPAVPPALLAAADEQRLWIATPSNLAGWSLLVIDADADDFGAARLVARFTQRPDLLAACDGDVIAAWRLERPAEPTPAETDSAEADDPQPDTTEPDTTETEPAAPPRVLWRLRRVSVPAMQGQLANPAAEPPLVGPENLADLTCTDAGLVALIRRTDGAGLSPWATRTLVGADWTEPLALDLSLDGTVESDGLGVLARAPAAAVVLAGDGRLHAVELHRPDEPAEPVDLALPADGSRHLAASPAGPIVANRRGPDLALSLVRDGRLLPIAVVEAVPEPADVAAMGDRTVVAWLAPPAGPDVAPDDQDATDAAPAPVPHVAVIDRSGAVLFRGPLDVPGPVPSLSFWVLGYLLISFVGTLGLFVLRSEADRGAAFALPEGTAIAPVTRRYLAAWLDAMPGFALLALLERAQAVTDASIDLTGHPAVLPVVLAAAGAVVLAAAGEAIFGRSVGKAALMCWTIGPDGRKPAAWRAIARTVAKVLCPGVGVFLLQEPAQPHPGAFRTTVITRIPGPPGSAPGPPRRPSPPHETHDEIPDRSPDASDTDRDDRSA